MKWNASDKFFFSYLKHTYLVKFFLALHTLFIHFSLTAEKLHRVNGCTQLMCILN